jgi:hypothetical protein
LLLDAAIEAVFLATEPFGPRFGVERGNIVLITSSSKKRRFFLRIRAGWKQTYNSAHTSEDKSQHYIYSIQKDVVVTARGKFNFWTMLKKLIYWAKLRNHKATDTNTCMH